MLAPRHIPNLISIGRIVLTLPIVLALLRQDFRLALLFFTLAGISDGLDGFLAKQYQWQSRLGALLDPMADKILLAASSLSLAWLGLLPVWLVGVILLRDLIIIGGAFFWNVLIGQLEAKPTIISKINTFVQIGLVLAVVSEKAFVWLPAGTLEALVWITLATTLTSGMDYVWEWSKNARANLTNTQDH